MSDIKQIAAERLRRVSMIRKRVIATALVAFALLWAVLFVQLATGHDPALPKQTARSTTSTSSNSSGATTSSGSGGTSSSGSSTSGATTPLTTSQS